MNDSVLHKYHFSLTSISVLKIISVTVNE